MRLPDRGAQIDAPAARQVLAAAEMIVEEQSEPDEPGRALLGRVRQHEAHRPNDMRCGSQQNFALDQRFAHQAELVIFEIAQAAMDQFAGTRRRALGQIVLLAQDDRETAARSVPGDAGAVDAAANDEQIDLTQIFHREPVSTG